MHGKTLLKLPLLLNSISVSLRAILSSFDICWNSFVRMDGGFLGGHADLRLALVFKSTPKLEAAAYYCPNFLITSDEFLSSIWIRPAKLNRSVIMFDFIF